MSKLFSCLGGIIFCIGTLSAQQYTTTSVSISKNIALAEWETYISTPDFKIEYKKADCDPAIGYDFEAIMMRFTNNTGSDLMLAWHIDLFYDGVCRTCGYDEYDRMVFVPANQVVETSCDNDQYMDLRPFSRFNDAQYERGANLTSFQLSNLHTNQ